MRFFFYMLVITMVCSLCMQPLYAQTKKVPDKKEVKLKPATSPKRDTIITYDIKKTDTLKVALAPDPVVMRTTETIIIIDKLTGKPKVKDTSARYIRPIDTVIRMKGNRKVEITTQERKRDTIKIVRVPDNCGCVAMNVKATDTLRPDDYVNYQFNFKNNCKEAVYISSAAFGFLVFNKNGTPAKMLRKLDYVKRYDYPDFVELKPKEEYQFSFGDDPFFQYELRQGWEYKFTFTYYNNLKYRPAPTKTYMCSEFRDKMIRVK